jgi:hypothetical protein
VRRLQSAPPAGLFYLPGGVIAAILLGMALIPLREMTHAGNFIFAFVILIIVAGERGGRRTELGRRPGPQAALRAAVWPTTARMVSSLNGLLR